MRFIIREQDSERLLAAGLFAYQRNGRPSGATEEWRLTEVLGQYQILRTDIDERESRSNQSTLFHLLINRDNQPDRLKIRFFSPSSQGWADLMINEDGIILSQDFGHGRIETEADFDDSVGFLYPSVTWLGTWLSHQGTQPASKLYYLSKNDSFELIEILSFVKHQRGEPVTVGGHSITTDHYSLNLSDEKQDFWIDSFDLTVKAALSEDLTVVETRYIRQM